MIRTEPFTTVHIEIQGGRFDLAPRLFSSVGEAYRLCTTTQNDYRELTPEFFGSPEFLVNADGFDLGVVDGEHLSDVALPPWAHGSPIEFVYLNRKALECAYVSENLQNWIELVWGFKQCGEKAVEANNVFVKDLYPDVWSSIDLRDADARSAAELLLCHFGQIPPQLFDRAHQRRDPPPAPPHFGSVRAVQFNAQALLTVQICVEGTRSRIYGIDEGLRCHFSNIDVVDALKSGSALRRNSMKPPRLSRAASLAFGSELFKELKAAPKRSHCFWRDGFLIANACDVVHTRHGYAKPETLLHHRTGVVCLAADGDWISVADSESSFSLYRGGKPDFSIPIFTSSVRKCAVSAPFKLVVCGTRDGSLVFCSLSPQVLVRIVDLGGRHPIQILITPSWGFVCVYLREVTEGVLKHILALYTVNGDPIREVAIEEPIVAWAAYTDNDGFDFIGVAFDDGRCHFFEAFWLDIGEPVYEVAVRVVGIGFCKSVQAGIIVLTNGQVIIVPLDPE
jgi:hypothetical protein